MTTKASETRHKFSGVWDEIDYLYHKLLYWFWQKENRRRAAPFAKRLARLLKREAGDDQTPFTEGAWALLHELDGDLEAALKHRSNEVRLLKRLFDLARKQHSLDAIFAYYDYEDLGDRLDLLAILYHDTGRLDRAVEILKESRSLAEKHGHSFDGQDLLEDYVKEKAQDPPNGVASRPSPLATRVRRTRRAVK